MPFDIAPLLTPSQCAVLVFECQEGVVGENSSLPTLRKAVVESNMIPTLASFLDRAREAGLHIFHCTAHKRADGIGNPYNTPLEMRMRAQQDGDGAPQVGEIVPELALQPGDVEIRREHGMTGFYGSPLDGYLRNTGTRTVIMTGVSVNVGVMGTTIDAVNHGYSVVVPTDCVAGDPPEYAEQALRYSIRNVAFLSTADEIARHWDAH